MRLAGTINVPNQKKRERGRKNQLASVVWELSDPGLEYPIETFPELDLTHIGSSQVLLPDATTVDIASLPASVNVYTKDLIEQGDDPEKPIGSPGARYRSRSEVVYRVTCDLVRAGCPEPIIGGILLNPRYGISVSVREKRNPKKYAERQIGSAKDAVSRDWPDVTKSGQPRATLRNTILAIRRLGIIGEYDEFHRRKVLGGLHIQEYQGELSDDGCTSLRIQILETFQFDPGIEHTREAANAICLENRYHPIRDYLRSLEWDGTPRLDTWMTRYLGAEDTPLTRAIARIVLVAAVRRVRQPGIKFDNIVVFEGRQGSGKSTALYVLAGHDNFSDQEILTLDPKAQMEAIEGVWIYEIGELQGISRAETTKVKAFASRSVDRGRPAYARFREDRPRQTIFIGTTNDSQYLRDPTGNRRFWPVSTGTIDLDALRRDRDQLWAEAAYVEAQGQSITLPEELWGTAAVEQEARLEDDPWQEILSSACGDLIAGFERITSSELLEDTLGVPPERQQQFHLKRLGSIMRKIGWDGPKSLKLADGKVARGYERRPSSSYDPKAREAHKRKKKIEGRI